MKSFLLGVLAAAFLIVVCGYCFLSFGLPDFRGSTPPSALETSVMRAAVHASVKRRAPEVANPFPPTDENLLAVASSTWMTARAAMAG